ncbi:organic solute transporter subunit alpha-like [Ptychodera flava]|uniref:organic solute transporter subunit alpha-like n=1 Tax=Ptychodera flava TaxID=63121 RepID=UPI003969F46D
MAEYDTTVQNGSSVGMMVLGNISMIGNKTLPPVGQPLMKCFPGILPAALYIKVWETKHFVMISIAVILTAIIIGLFLDSLKFLNAQIPLKRRRSRILWIMGIYPVFATSSLMALFMPRASILTGFTASVYLSVTLYQFMLLIFDYFGGGLAMLTMLKGQKMMIGTPPVLIFCCCCLPKVPVTRKSITWVRRLVLQVAFVRPMVLFISAVMWADGSGLYTPGKFSPRDAFLYLNVASVVSTLAAFQCIVILFKLTKEPLQNYKIVPKFFSVQLALIFSNLQSVIIGFLMNSGTIPCSMTWSRAMNGQFIHNFALIVEMFLFAVLARISYRKRTGNLDYVAPPRPSFFRPKSFAPTYPERNGDVETYLKAKGEYDGIDDNSNSPEQPGTVPAICTSQHVRTEH